ncbi:molybdopterin guanine dinucleotide-containing S/N-oxide reductase [Paralimibaculum aggregatum]|uniref:Molybdopterin guanine dinucleotide-containing S/N-oxide reductase n=1 Tax=Paralimibaculum aggregatum TaxID=3036245 RepID=A0ABQ6LKK4_9RHOB|nr:molybdopterin-dependent oxidoreductase [Limibaculum sp. NKW23]GMG81763.1 molybdopterin guanine dinucleotide-containing S/N-oxide reductase [Limibaculum sp. NKW23]
MTPPDDRTHPQYFATHWGTWEAVTENGRLTGVRPWAGDPHPAMIGPGIVEAVHHPSRIRRPAVRRSFLEKGAAAERGSRGAEPFVELPWDEALDLAAAEIDRVRRSHGNEAIFGGSYGWASAGRFHHAQSQVHRFLNCAGGYTASIDTYSYAAVSALTPHIIGHFRKLMLDQATSWDSIAAETELFVMFGGLPLKNAQVNSGGVGRHTARAALRAAHARGCRFVSIGPIRADTMPEIGADWIALRPGTDTALMLALAHVLVREDLHDRGFLARCTTGFERFLPYLMGETDGQPKTPAWAAAITGIPAEAIAALARRMAAQRTMIGLAWSVQRADHGEQPAWMAIVLAAMLGQIGLPGGGVGIGYGSENGIGNPVRPFRFPALPQGQNPVEAAIPVARIADALLDPGGTYDFNGAQRRYPDLRLLYWAGGNPFHHHQDINRLVRALQRPETIIVNEIWWTPMARHADIVFPTTSPVEREDIAMTHWEPLIVAMRQAIPPEGEARDDYAVFAGLAGRLGLEAAFTEGRSAEDWLRHLWDQARQRAAEAGFALPGLAELRAGGPVSLPGPERPAVLLEAFRADPEAHPLETPSGRIEIFSERIAGFGYDDCPGHPVWLEPCEWLGGAEAARFPLHLVSNQPATRLHGQLDPGSVSRASKIAGREPITMHPADAAARGLAAGDVVRVWNARGACLAGLRISDEVMPGVVQLATGAWHDPERRGEPGALCKHGNPNVLTRDKGSSRLGQGPSAHTALVEVARLDGPPPPVTAFDPPELLPRR